MDTFTTRLRQAAYLVAAVSAFVYTAGFVFGRWVHQLNSDVTRLYTGRIFLDEQGYARKLRLRRLSYKAIAMKLGCTTYHARKLLASF